MGLIYKGTFRRDYRAIGNREHIYAIKQKIEELKEELNPKISSKGITNIPYRFLFLYIILCIEVCAGIFLQSESVSYAQMLANFPSQQSNNIVANEVFFSEKFIRNNKIKSVTATYSFKRELMPIMQTGNVQNFEFNTIGKPVMQFETFTIAGNMKDTIVAYFIYNNKEQPAIKRASDGSGFYSYSYEYDTVGNVIKQVYSRDENTGSKNNFIPGKQFIINSETFVHEQPSPAQKKKRYFNDNGMEYKTETAYYNEYGNLSEEETRFVVSGRKSAITYKYDEYFRVSEKVDFSVISEENRIVSVFSYDEFGNMLSEKISRNGTLKITREFLYDKKTFLLDAQLVKDEATQTIQIYKYSYTFY